MVNILPYMYATLDSGLLQSLLNAYIICKTTPAITVWGHFVQAVNPSPTCNQYLRRIPSSGMMLTEGQIKINKSTATQR